MDVPDASGHAGSVCAGVAEVVAEKVHVSLKPEVWKDVLGELRYNGRYGLASDIEGQFPVEKPKPVPCFKAGDVVTWKGGVAYLVTDDDKFLCLTGHLMGKTLEGVSPSEYTAEGYAATHDSFTIIGSIK